MDLDPAIANQAAAVLVIVLDELLFHGVDLKNCTLEADARSQVLEILEDVSPDVRSPARSVT